MEFDIEKLKASLPLDESGNLIFSGDEVVLYDREGHEISATLEVDDYMTWNFDFSDRKKAEKYFGDDAVCYGLSYSEFYDEYSGDWKIKKA